MVLISKFDIYQSIEIEYNFNYSPLFFMANVIKQKFLFFITFVNFIYACALNYLLFKTIIKILIVNGVKMQT